MMDGMNIGIVVTLVIGALGVAFGYGKLSGRNDSQDEKIIKIEKRDEKVDGGALRADVNTLKKANDSSVVNHKEHFKNHSIVIDKLNETNIQLAKIVAIIGARASDKKAD